MRFLASAFLVGGFACLLGGCLGARERTDLLPRYGGEDRSAGTPLREDRAMVGLAELRYPSRAAASADYVAQALVLLERGDGVMAMRRLNRAWTLDPSNPDLEAAFAAAASLVEASGEGEGR